MNGALSYAGLILLVMAFGLTRASAQMRDDRADIPSGGSMPLLNDWKFSVEGHARTMQETYRGVDFGLGDIDNDAWVHQRVQVMLRAEYESTFALVTELTWGRMWGKRNPLAPPDEDKPDFLQLFAEWKDTLADAGDDTLLIRGGRQTLYYGSGRLLSIREGANQRLAHDALLVSLSGSPGIRVDAFIASPVQIEDGAFDNRSHPDEVLFWSVYAVLPSPLGKEHYVDLYYIGLRDEDSIFAEMGGGELRHTIGTRWWSEVEPLVYNTEFILQFGETGDRDILAGAASLGVGYVFRDVPWRPTLMLRGDLISGGDASGDLHTFHPLFQANNYFNEGGFVSPSNLWNINPLVKLKPHPKVEVTMGVNFLWRFSAEDDVYGPPLQRLAGPAPGGERYLGTAYNAAISWQATSSTELSVGFTHHEAGSSLTSVGGGDEDYFQASVKVEF
ncbi:alginate export protein [Roseimicrobium gellanilyticum]|uniref:Alginate export protein n=1 Tax=Roseimicrobium gellanilyticum TaxID=748857 RepID=A0A366HHR6_9BACT|nr:alginate export family protein [Roseimicrobium gellanilyticum]RBP42308.1 alginate export protein [Roseimicrobium gellanilyticum]